MTRVNLILLAVLIFCALSVVTSQHQSRKAFIELQTEKERESKLDQEWRELQIESQTLGQHKRIEQIAARDLGMKVPDQKRTVVVVLDTQPPQPPTSATTLTPPKTDPPK